MNSLSIDGTLYHGERRKMEKIEKKYKNVAELLGEVSDDKEFNKSVENGINTKKIARMLFAMRCHAGLNQAQVAERMKCTQGKISKIENTLDVDISIGDLMNYCSAVNMRVEIGFFDKRLNMVETVKYYYFRLKGLLDKLIDSAKGDEVMERGVEKFTREAFCNITVGLIQCLQKAKVKKPEVSQLYVSKPVNLEEVENVETTEKC